MIASDPLALLRNLLTDPEDSGPQFSNIRLLNFLDEAQRQAVRETSSPESYQVFPTVLNVQEYQVFEQLITHAVYCAGKLLAPSSPAILEGWNIGLWSQNPQGSTPVTGSGAVPGTVGTGSPGWVNAPPQFYPTTTGQEFAYKPTVQPYGLPAGHTGMPLQAERYYWRSPGTIGIIPQPSNVCQVVIYGVCLPPPIVVTSQTLLVPDSYRMYLVSYALWLARLSENSTNPGQNTLIEAAFQSYLRERASCLLKVRNAKGKVPRTFNSIPSRVSRSQYVVRRSGGCR